MLQQLHALRSLAPEASIGLEPERPSELDRIRKSDIAFSPLEIETPPGPGRARRAQR